MAESHPEGGAASVTKEQPTEKSTECRYCGKDFDTYMARRKHEGTVHTEPYQDEDKLRELYWGEKLSMEGIGERYGVPSGTINYWMDKFDIDTRHVNEHQERPGVNLSLDSRGYMKWNTYVGDRNYYVQVHRLLAIAKYGYDEVCGKVVHHKNNIGGDNRPENIEVMTAAEHGKHHHNLRDCNE